MNWRGDHNYSISTKFICWINPAQFLAESKKLSSNRCLISANTVAAYNICLDIDQFCCGLQHMSWYRPILLRLTAYVLISTNTVAADSICLDIDQYCCGLQHICWYRQILLRLTAYVLISTNTVAAYSICLDIDQYYCGLQHMCCI